MDQVHDCKSVGSKGTHCFGSHIGMSSPQYSVIPLTSVVMALDNSPARIVFRRIRLWFVGSILVRCRVQPHDRVFRLARNLLQAQDPRGSYVARGGSHPIWASRTHCIHGVVSGQQHLRVRQHVVGCRCRHLRHVSECGSLVTTPLLTRIHRTGMHVIAATFLLPLGVTVYTFVGGIKAT